MVRKKSDNMSLDPDAETGRNISHVDEDAGPVLLPESEGLVQKSKGPPIIILFFLAFAIFTAVWKKMVAPLFFAGDKVIEQPIQSEEGDRTDP